MITWHMNEYRLDHINKLFSNVGNFRLTPRRPSRPRLFSTCNAVHAGTNAPTRSSIFSSGSNLWQLFSVTMNELSNFPGLRDSTRSPGWKSTILEPQARTVDADSWLKNSDSCWPLRIVASYTHLSK